MKAITVFLGLSFVAACAVGTPAGDGVVVKKGDGGSTHDSGSTTTPPPSSDPDSGTTEPPPSDPCANVVCNTDETCTNGQCIPNATTTSNAPPQGTCAHSLCTSGSALDEGCDTEGCNVIICDPSYLADDFCCTTSWDAQCEQEVTDYCSPYSCN